MIKAYKFGLNVTDDSIQFMQCNNERREGHNVIDICTGYPTDDNDFSTLGEWQFVDYCWNESEKICQRYDRATRSKSIIMFCT